MILNPIRNRIYKRQFSARQNWSRNKKIHTSNMFNFLNLEYKTYGNKFPSKFFYIIRRSPGAGFFSNLNFVIHNLLICSQLKMIPIIDMENYITLYNCKIKINGSYNVWDYYFKPVSKYSLKDVYKSKNVVFCDNRTSKKGFSKSTYEGNFKYLNGFNNLDSRHKRIVKRYIKFKKDILIDSQNYVRKNFSRKKILGVCFRGSDQKKAPYHPYPPSEKQLLNATNYLIQKHGFDKIYLCTEDSDFLKFYKKKFGNILLYNNSPRTTDKVDLFDNSSRKHRFNLGRANIVDMLNLAKTNYLLFAPSNIPEAALFFSKKKIPHKVINNGMKGNIFISQFSYSLKKLLPQWLGGFKNVNF